MKKWGFATVKAVSALVVYSCFMAVLVGASFWLELEGYVKDGKGTTMILMIFLIATLFIVLVWSFTLKKEER